MTLNWAEIEDINKVSQNTVSILDNNYNVPDISPFRGCSNCGGNYNSNLVESKLNTNFNHENTHIPSPKNSFASSPFTELSNILNTKPFLERERSILNNERLSEFNFDITPRSEVKHENLLSDNPSLCDNISLNENSIIDEKLDDNIFKKPKIYKRELINNLPAPYNKKKNYKLLEKTVSLPKKIKVNDVPNYSFKLQTDNNNDKSQDIKWMSILYIFILSFILLSIN